MLRKTKTIWSIIFFIAALCLSSCSPSSAMAKTQEAEAADSQPVLKTAIGDLVIASARLVDEVNGQKSQPEGKILLVILTQPGKENLTPGEFKLEDFQKMIQESNGEIYVSGKEDLQIISTMAGWVEDEFAMGFMVPVQDSYTLHWPENDPIALDVQAE
ncbi:hypothetical protein LARV_00702 [Longilinea arvoryzae]|uniref:Uncharacterized protein n=2 Tax=Longilinea arvoryzae TaxID=360412 RepID=A0A0S7BG06_9CHLR|nr:hypothetical protein LARV_00702 [Longilinea arvoryzae]